MTTQAKYGWATGLIVMGILFSLPFRHQGDRNTGTGQELASAVPSDEKKSKAVNGKDGTQPENPPATRTGADSDRALKSSLLPETSPAMREALAPKTSQPVEIVEEVPSRFRPEDIRPGSTPLDHSGPSGHLPGGESMERTREWDRPAKLQPVEFSKPPSRRMANNVGPYRMKPVPSSQFLPASQSSQNPAVATPGFSRSRRVVHYKLRDGDSLRSIAQRYLGDPGRYQEILADNQHILTNGENFLPVGQFITIIAQ
ncbi:MAG: LysM domain-containing protein [Planctomycetota bacterium]|nr:LysM domain-containing protein [Planctomycetota bacterium]